MNLRKMMQGAALATAAAAATVGAGGVAQAACPHDSADTGHSAPDTGSGSTDTSQSASDTSQSTSQSTSEAAPSSGNASQGASESAGTSGNTQQSAPAPQAAPDSGSGGSAAAANEQGRQNYSAGQTTQGEGTAEFGTEYGDSAIGGDSGGIANAHGAPFVNVDMRCAVPAAQGVGGNVLGGPVNACSTEPVDQFDAPERII